MHERGNGTVVMPDLRISYSVLESATTTAGGLITAVDNFAGNWPIHRKKLPGKTKNLRSMPGTALTEFPKADHAAASWLTRKTK